MKLNSQDRTLKFIKVVKSIVDRFHFQDGEGKDKIINKNKDLIQKLEKMNIEDIKDFYRDNKKYFGRTFVLDKNVEEAIRNFPKDKALLILKLTEQNLINEYKKIYDNVIKNFLDDIDNIEENQALQKLIIMIKNTGRQIYDFKKNDSSIFSSFKKYFTSQQDLLENELKIIKEKISAKDNANNNNQVHKSGKEIKQKKTTSDAEKIDEYIKLALNLGDIPRGGKYLSKTMYRKLGQKEFLLQLSRKIDDLYNNKYANSNKHRITLDSLFMDCQERIRKIEDKEKKKQKKAKEIEYIDNINYEDQISN